MSQVIIDDHTDEIIEAIQRAALKSRNEMGLACQGFAQVNITNVNAVDTGALRNSITYQIVGNDVFVGTDMNYAIYVEMGTGRYAGGRQTPWAFKDSRGNWHMTTGMPARPYLKPAATDHIEEYKRIIQNNFKNA